MTRAPQRPWPACTVLAFALALGTACGGPPPKRSSALPWVTAPHAAYDVVTREVAVAGRARTFLVSAPHERKGRLPLVFVFHGGGEDPAAMRAYADLEARARTAAIFVYPRAEVQNVWADEYALHWDARADLAFFDAAVADVTHAFPIDERRVYAIGLSSGAYFANQVACERGHVIRAFVAAEGGGPFGDCELPVDAMIVHDPVDPVVDYGEGRTSFARWLDLDGCNRQFRTAPGDMCKLHVTCASGRRVADCAAAGGLHALEPGVREAALRFFGL